MKIPSDALERRTFYAEILQQCTGTRSTRFEFNRTMKNYYQFGTKDQEGCAYNKIAATVDTLWSFIYSSDTAKFSIHLGTTATDGDLMKTPALRAEINDQWRASGSSLSFSVGGKYSLVYGAMLFKTLWHDGRAKPFIVEPHQFGVLREDIMDLDDQEAFVHCYQITRTQLDAMLKDNPRRESIMEQAGRSSDGITDMGVSEAPEGVGRLILSNGVATGVGGAKAGGTIDGGITAVGGSGQYDYTPRVEAELIDMYELYIWNDEVDDYQIVTLCSPSIIIFDRKNFNLPKMHGFTVLRPEHDSYDYFWGVSFAARLTWLQDWRTTRMDQIKDLLNKQVQPPMVGIGMSGIAEEKMLALNRAGGQLSTAMPGADIKVISPQMPANIFAEIQEIDQMFSDAAGISGILQGHAQGSIRSRGQADLMARLGSSRIKQKALVVEEACARVATLTLRNVQENSAQRFQSVEKDPSGAPLTFVADQFTNDFEVRVDSHSSSPVFVEDQRETAGVLLKAGCIDQSTLLEMFDPPNVQELQAKLKVMQAAREKQRQEEMQLKQQELASKQGQHPGKK